MSTGDEAAAAAEGPASFCHRPPHHTRGRGWGEEEGEPVRSQATSGSPGLLPVRGHTWALGLRQRCSSAIPGRDIERERGGVRSEHLPHREEGSGFRKVVDVSVDGAGLGAGQVWEKCLSVQLPKLMGISPFGQ